MKLSHTIKFGKKAFFVFCVTLDRLLFKRGIPIFLYHSIDETGSPISTHPENFRWQMQYLAKRGWSTMRLGELIAAMQSGHLPQKRFVVTFDDGFQNLHTVALPILKELGFSATVYLATEFVSRSNSFVRVIMPELPMLTWEDLKALQKEGWDIESHGHTHINLPDLELSRLHWELTISREHIRQHLGTEARHFCYPRGRYSREVVAAVKAAGYESAASFRSGLAHARSNPWLLSRLPINDRATPLHFRALLTEPYSWFSVARRFLRISFGDGKDLY